VCVPRPAPARPPLEPAITLDQVNAAVASLAALTRLRQLHVRGYGNANYHGLRGCLPALAQLRSLKLQHAEPGLSGLQGLFIENPVAFGLDCLGALLQLTRLEVQVSRQAQGAPRRAAAAAAAAAAARAAAGAAGGGRGRGGACQLDQACPAAGSCNRCLPALCRDTRPAAC
jgi:hypothetical protein